MSAPKKQHFIPQFFLKSFSFGEIDKERIWTFDKKTCRAFVTSVRDAAHENRFYDGKNVDGQELEAESILQWVDGIGSAAISAVIKNESLPTEGQTFVDLSYFIAAQIARVPAIRNQMEFVRLATIAKWGSDIRAEGDKRPISAYGPEDSKFSSIEFLREVPKLAQLLQGKIWFLLKAPAESRFLLSDNPVVRHNYLDYGARGSLGLRQDGIDVGLPITSRLAIQCLCPKIAVLFAANPEGREMLACRRDGRPLLMKEEHVEFTNSLQVVRSERFMYAQNEATFQIVREMLQEHPDLIQPASATTIVH